MDVDVKFGDLWQLGKHKLLCGDASEIGLWTKMKSPSLAIILKYMSKSWFWVKYTQQKNIIKDQHLGRITQIFYKFPKKTLSIL